MTKHEASMHQECLSHLKTLISATRPPHNSPADDSRRQGGRHPTGSRRQSMAARRESTPSLPNHLCLRDVEVLVGPPQKEKSKSKAPTTRSSNSRAEASTASSQQDIPCSLEKLYELISRLRESGVQDDFISNMIQTSTELQHEIEKLRASEKSQWAEMGRRRIESTRQVGLANRKTAIRRRTEREEAEVMFAKMRRRYLHQSKKHQLSVASANLGISVSTLKRRLKGDGQK